jgi:adenine phosphoribosyltransferase
MDLQTLIEDVPGFPSAGVVFRDITPLLLDPAAFRHVIDQLAARYAGQVDRVASIESRGFILGAPLALALGCGFIPVRKLGKLPRETISRDYALEYGRNHLEIHVDAVEPGQRVLVVDDVLATGGTARAAADLVERLGGVVVGAAFLIEITPLKGRHALEGKDVFALLSY